MSPPPLPGDPAAALRRQVYRLLTVVAVAIAVAKIVGAENVVEPSRHKAPAANPDATPPPDRYGADAPDPAERTWPAVRPAPTPTFGSNDRSRWATVRALVEDGTYVIGRRREDPRLDPGAAVGSPAGYLGSRVKAAANTPPGLVDEGVVFEDGNQSIDKVMNPRTREFYSSKPPLMATALAGEYWVLRHGGGLSIKDDRWLVVCLILLTVNAVPFAVYLVLLARLIEDHGETDFGRVFAFAAAAVGTFLLTFATVLNNHTPAAFCVLFAVYPLLKRGGPPAILSPGRLAASGFFAGLAAMLDLPALMVPVGLGVPLLLARPRTGWVFWAAALVPVAAQAGCNYAALGTVVPAYNEFGGEWYNYEGSHWARAGTPQAKGIDFSRDPPAVYAFHLLLGHHGWFSLTPVWLLGAVGLWRQAWAGRREAWQVVRRRVVGPGGPWTPRVLAGFTLVASVVLVGFFLTRTGSYNYGGVTSGPRWLFWLTPLWVLGLLPAADWVGRRRGGRLLAAGLLGVSVLSGFYPAWNPWRHPWLLQAGENAGAWEYGR